MSKCVYGKAYPFLNDVMENPSSVYPNQVHFIKLKNVTVCDKLLATNQNLLPLGKG